jgi:hypothetical protein
MADAIILGIVGVLFIEVLCGACAISDRLEAKKNEKK